MNYQQFITRNPEVLQGKPIIRGTRISVELVMKKLASGYAKKVSSFRKGSNFSCAGICGRYDCR